MSDSKFPTHFKEYDALEILDEMNQVHQLTHIFEQDHKLVFNIKLMNTYYDSRNKLESWIKTLIERWEQNYGEKFNVENYLSAYEGAGVGYEEPILRSGSAPEFNAPVEQEDTRVSQAEDDHSGSSDESREDSVRPPDSV